MRWADEISGSEPLPVLEPFFILAALELGDPDSQHEWLMRNAADFHQLYRTYRQSMGAPAAIPADSADVLIQYMIWYPREASKTLSGKA